MKIFFSHPPFTFQTDTEETCIEMIRDYFEDVKKIYNPLEYGLKHDLRDFIHQSNVVVGMAILGNFTFLVHKEVEEGREKGAEIYTIRVRSKEEIGKIEKGVPDEIQKLSKDESDRFSNEMMKENRESIWSLLVGKRDSRF